MGIHTLLTYTQKVKSEKFTATADGWHSLKAFWLLWRFGQSNSPRGLSGDGFNGSHHGRVKKYIVPKDGFKSSPRCQVKKYKVSKDGFNDSYHSRVKKCIVPKPSTRRRYKSGHGKPCPYGKAPIYRHSALWPLALGPKKRGEGSALSLPQAFVKA